MTKTNTSIGLVAFTVIALCLATPAAGGKGGKGGKGGATPVCFQFQDGAGDRIGSDLLGDYCNDKRAKIEAILTQDGHLVLRTNKSERPGYGRSLFVDWTLGPGTVPLPFGELPADVTLSSTVDLDTAGIPHFATLSVAGFNDAIDLRSMALGEIWYDVNVRVMLAVLPDDPYETFRLQMRFEPHGLIDFRSCPADTPSDLLEVTCGGEDAAGKCNRWTVSAHYDPETLLGDRACVGDSFQTNNEAYFLPFTLEAWVAD